MKIIRFFAVMAIFVSIVACKETKKNSKITTEEEPKTQTEQQIATTEEEPKTQTEQQITTEKEENWKTFSDKKFFIRYPSDWTIRVPGVDSKFQIFSPEESGIDTFVENCKVTSENVAQIPDIDLDKYMKIAQQEVTRKLPYIKIIEKGEVVNGNDTYKKISYKGNFRGTGMIIKQYITIKNKTAYTFTEVLATSNYEEYENVMDKIFSTFKIK